VALRRPLDIAAEYRTIVRRTVLRRCRIGMTNHEFIPRITTLAECLAQGKIKLNIEE
jgi:hypothetical protein